MVHFTARSHRPFTREGIIAEAKSYIDSHILLAPGRYRDLQLEHMVSRNSSPHGTGQYKMRLHDRAEAEHRDMVDRYRHRNDLTYGEKPVTCSRLRYILRPELRRVRAGRDYGTICKTL